MTFFGTLKPNGYRQFNTAYVEIPKKMGKSELATAVALLLTCGDSEERAEVYGCAADMVRMCPALNKRVKILASQKRIVYLPTNSFYQVLSAEAYSKHGFNIHGVVFDELHTQPDRKLFDVMTKGSGDARTQPLYFLITTAGTVLLTVHRWFARKSCPGNWLFERMTSLADEVNGKLRKEETKQILKT